MRRFLSSVLAIAAVLLMATISAPRALAQGVGMPAGQLVQGEEMKAFALAQLSLTERNIIQIAQSAPADTLGWNPGASWSPRPPDWASHDYGRTLANLCLHLSNLNFSAPPRWGAAKSPDFTGAKDYEDSTTDRDKLVQQLKVAFDYGQAEVGKMSAADLAKTYKVGNQMMSGNLIVAEWMSEINHYFGQAQAYAHMHEVSGTDPAGYQKGPMPKAQSQK
jgi:hypothetical protein